MGVVGGAGGGGIRSGSDFSVSLGVLGEGVSADPLGAREEVVGHVGGGGSSSNAWMSSRVVYSDCIWSHALVRYLAHPNSQRTTRGLIC